MTAAPITSSQFYASLRRCIAGPAALPGLGKASRRGPPKPKRLVLALGFGQSAPSTLTAGPSKKRSSLPESLLLLHFMRSLYPEPRSLVAVTQHSIGQTQSHGQQLPNSTLNSWIEKLGLEHRVIEVPRTSDAEKEPAKSNEVKETNEEDEQSQVHAIDMDAFAQECHEAESTWLVLPTTMSDQAELIPHRIMKNSGVEGLCGFLPAEFHPQNATIADQRMRVIRPFLDFSRAEIRATCVAEGFGQDIEGVLEAEDKPLFPPETEKRVADFGKKMLEHNRATRSHVRAALLQHSKQDHSTGASYLVIDAEPGSNLPDSHWFSDPFIATRVIRDLIQYSSPYSGRPTLTQLDKVYETMIRHYRSDGFESTGKKLPAISMTGVLLIPARDKATKVLNWVFARAPPARQEAEKMAIRTAPGQAVIWDNRFALRIGKPAQKTGRKDVANVFEQVIGQRDRTADDLLIRFITAEDYHSVRARLKGFVRVGRMGDRHLIALNRFIDGLPMVARGTIPAVAAAEPEDTTLLKAQKGKAMAFAIPSLGINLENWRGDIGMVYLKRNMFREDPWHFDAEG